jgi:hypothetical protein
VYSQDRFLCDARAHYIYIPSSVLHTVTFFSAAALTDRLPAFRLNPFTLTFRDNELERRFLERFFRERLTPLRVEIVVVILLFTLTDILQLVTALHTPDFALKFGVTTALIAMLILFLVLTCTRWWFRLSQIATSFIILAIWLWGLVVAALSGKIYSTSIIVALLIYLQATFLLSTLRFFVALLTGLAMVSE